VSNKLFIPLIAAALLALVGWMVYDYRSDSQAIQAENVRRDVIGDGSSGSSAAIQYLFHFPNPVYSHALSTSQIEALSQSGGGERYHIYGLCQGNYKMDALYKVSGSKKWFKNEYSMWVENLRVEFGYTTINVYITSNYPEGSCEYQQTLDHENQHVETHRQVYAQYQEILRKSLADTRDIPLSSNPIIASSWEEGKDRVGKMISAVTDPVFDRFKAELETEQDQIDTPENYTALRNSCQNW
jgi:hypothetical protein